MLLASPASASDVDNGFLGLSFTGDGHTPPALALFEAQDRAATAGRFLANASPGGDASYAVGFETPPGLMAPALGISYGGAGAHSVVGRSWSLDFGMVARRPGARARSLAWADVNYPVLLTGGGLDGVLYATGSTSDPSQDDPELPWHTGTWAYASKDAAIVAVSSSYEDCSGDGQLQACLEVRSGGVTTTLAADPREERYPSVLRPLRREDRQGNLIDYQWDGPYLLSVAYGHSTTAPEPVVEVVYTYLEDRGYSTFDASSRTVSEIRDILSGVEVFTRDAGGLLEVRYGYELLYQDVDGEVMLESVVRVGGAVDDLAALRRTIAWFDYARWDDAAEDHYETGTDLWSLQVSSTSARGSASRTVNWTTSADVSGDGLLDTLGFMASPGSFWQYLQFSGDPGAPDSLWEAANPVDDYVEIGLGQFPTNDFNTQYGVAGAGLDDTPSVHCSREEVVSLGIRASRDVDGDGFLDIITTSSELPDAWEQPTQEDIEEYVNDQTVTVLPQVAAWCTLAHERGRDVPGGPTWTVFYGEAGGTFGLPTPYDDVPAAFLSIERRPKLPEIHPNCLVDGDCPLDVPADLWSAPTHDRLRFDGPTLDLRDMNGDGWLDIIETHPQEDGLRVFLKDPSRTGGWAADPIDWTAAASDAGTSIRDSLIALSQSEGEVDWDQFSLDVSNQLELGPDAYTGVESLDEMSPVIGEMFQTRMLTDINGDGLPDWVDADPQLGGLIVSTPTLVQGVSWDVWLGTPVGFEPVKRSWHVPSGHRFLGYTDEGRAHVKSLSPPNTAGQQLVWDADLGCIQFEVPNSVGPSEGGGGYDCGEGYWIQTTDNDGNIDFTWHYDCGFTVTEGSCSTATDGVMASNVSGQESEANLALSTVSRSRPRAAWRWGWPQRQLSAMLDVDADGRADLVVFQPIDSSDTRNDVFNQAIGTWYRNLGDGFDVGRPTPQFWGWDLGVNQAAQEILISPYILSLPEVVEEQYELYSQRSMSLNRGLAKVSDFNGDGRLDVAFRELSLAVQDDDGRDGMVYEPWTLKLGTGTRPGLLTSIETNHGALTELEYTSSSFAWPSGDLYEPHTMAQHKPLLTGMTVEDQVSGHAAYRSMEYEGGICEGGACWGFEDVVVTEFLHDPDIHPAVDPFGGGGRPFQAMSRTSTSYWLDRDYAVPVLRTIDTSSVAPTPDPGGGWNTPLDWQRSMAEWSYDLTTGPVATARVKVRKQKAFGPPETSVVETLSVHLLREDETDLVTDVVHTNDVYLDLVDPLAALTDDEENVHVHIDYAWSTDGELRVPIRHQTTGYDPVYNLWTLQEEGRFYYDGSLDHGLGVTDGLMTRQEVDAGRPAGTGGVLSDEVLVWDFTYTDRGAMASTTDPRGAVSTSSSFVFGGALPEVQSQSVNIGYGPESDLVTGELLFPGELTLSTTTTFDALGRAVEVTDPNGVVARTTFDGLGRPVQSSTQAVGAPERVSGVMIYHDDDFTFPKIIESRTQEYIAATGGSSYHEVPSFQILDGFGDPIQQWTPSVDPGDYLVDNAVRDITGAVVRTSVPHKVTLAGQLPDMVLGAGTEWLTWTELDAFGSPHRTWEHEAMGLGEVEYSYPEPGVVISEDQAGYVKELHHDSHGRLVEVWEGRTGFVNMAADACQDVVSGDVRQKTGEYLYDARGRVTLFADASDNVYLYGFDGAGRLRQVWREARVGAPNLDSRLEPVDCRTHTSSSLEDGGSTKQCGSGSMLTGPVSGAQPWYSYSWEGHLPIQTWEGAWDVLLTTSAYDELGRPLLKSVFNEDEGSQGEGQWTTYAWSYDLDWLGSVSWQSDPAGKVTYDYAAEPVWGQRGYPTSTTRTWNEVAYTATVDTTFDSLGQVVQTVWPDGTTVDATYAPGGWLTNHAVSVVDTKGINADRTATVDYQYDQRGDLLGYNATETTSWLTLPQAAWQAVIDRGPTRVNRVTWNDNGVEKQFLDYTYDGAGRLREKRYQAIAGESAIVYDYDPLQRVSCMVHRDFSAGDTPLETYRYDPIGNPTLVQRPGSSKSPAWDYAPAFFSQVPDRFNSTTGRWDVHEYDPLGRMTRWDEVQIDPAVLQPGDPSLITRTFDYDGLGRVVRHTMDADPRAPGLTSDTLLVYDADNQAVYEERTIDRWETITRWAGERIDWGTTGVAQDVTLQLLPMLRAQNGELRWVMSDQSGAAFQIWASDGTELQFELGGVYGERLDDPTADWFHENPTVPFEDWRLDGLHGSEPDRTRGLVHHGARHTLLDDGRWLQPEPLLALGATEPAVGTNYAAYAGGNPLQNQDRTGFSPGAVTHDDNFFVQLGVAAMEELNSSAYMAAAPNPAGAGVAGVMTSVRVLSTAALNTARAVASRAGTTYLHNTTLVNGLGLGVAEAALGAPPGVTVVGPGGMVDDAVVVVGNAASKAGSSAGDVVYRHVDEAGNTIYVGITNDPARRAAEHALDSGKSGTMEVLTGRVDHDTARTIEAKLIREKIGDAMDEGLIDGTESVLEQLEKAGLNNKNRGRVPSRWNDADPADHMISDGETFDVNGG